MIYVNCDLNQKQRQKYKRCLKDDLTYGIRLKHEQLIDGIHKNENEDLLPFNIKLTTKEINKIYRILKNPNNLNGVDLDIDKNKIKMIKPQMITKQEQIYNQSIEEILYPIRALSNIDLEKYMYLHQINGKVFAKDQLVDKIKPNTCYIINLNNSWEMGSHWTILINSNRENNILYVDSFGIEYPPQEVLEVKANRKKLIVNTRRIQFDDTSFCGYYCLLLAKLILKDKLKYQDAISKFSKKPSLKNINFLLSNLEK